MSKSPRTNRSKKNDISVDTGNKRGGREGWTAESL